MYTLDGIGSVANFITAYEESQQNRDSHFQICNVFVVSNGYLFDVYLIETKLPRQYVTHFKHGPTHLRKNLLPSLDFFFFLL